MNTSSSPTGNDSFSLGEVLVKQGMLTTQQLENARHTAVARKRTVEDILREEGLVSDDLVDRAITAHFGVPSVQQDAQSDTVFLSLKKVFIRATRGEQEAHRHIIALDQHTQDKQHKKEKARRLRKLRRAENQHLRTQSSQEKTEAKRIKQSFHTSNLFGQREQKKEPHEMTKNWSQWFSGSIIPKESHEPSKQRIPSSPHTKKFVTNIKSQLQEKRKVRRQKQEELQKKKEEGRSAQLAAKEERRKSADLEKGKVRVEREIALKSKKEGQEKKAQEKQEQAQAKQRQKEELNRNREEQKKKQDEEKVRHAEEKRRLKEVQKVEVQRKRAQKIEERKNRAEAKRRHRQERIATVKNQWENWKKDKRTKLENYRATQKQQAEQHKLEQSRKHEERKRQQEAKQKAREDLRKKNAEEKKQEQEQARASKEALLQAKVERKKIEEEEKKRLQEEKQAEKAQRKQSKLIEKKVLIEQKKMIAESKKEARALKKEESSRSGTGLGKLFSKKKEVVETKSDDQIREEARQEAMRQVLIEQEKQKLQASTKGAEEEVISEKKEATKAVVEKIEVVKYIQTEKPISAEERENIHKKAFEEASQQFAAEKAELEKKVAAKAPATRKATSADVAKSQKALEEERTRFEEEKKQFEEKKSEETKAAVEKMEVIKYVQTEKPVSAEELENIRKKAFEEASQQFAAEKAELEKKVAAKAPATGKATSADVAKSQKFLEEEQALFEEEKKQFAEEKSKVETVAPTTGITQEQLEAEKEKARQLTLAAANERFEEEREKLRQEAEAKLKKVSEAGKTTLKKSTGGEIESGGMEAVKEAQQQLAMERASLESEKALVREESRKEARAELEKERTEFEIEKERLKQQALAEAQAEALVMTKKKGLFGLKQKEVLQKEIEKWKQQAAKLEKQRLELERTKVLRQEEGRMKSEEQAIAEERIKVEREKVALERAGIEQDADYTERMEEEREKLEEEKQQLATEKLEGKDNKKKKKKKGKKEDEIEEISEEEIDVVKILHAQNYIEESEFKDAEKKAKERSVSVESILKEEGLVTKQLIQNAIAEHYNMPFIDLNAQPPDTSVLELLPEQTSMAFHAIAIAKRDDGTLVVATSNPSKGEEIKTAVKEILPTVTNIAMVYTSKDAIESAFTFYRKPLDTRFRQIIEEHKKIAPEIIEEIFADAVQLGASDIHFEPQEKNVVVRFRVDGVMHEAGQLPKEYYEGIVNRIKIAGNMRIDEHFAAQDGAIRWQGGGKTMDVRVSIVPVVDGEKIVMRLLSEYVRTLTLSDLGFTDNQLDIILPAAHKPFGMILTTGPTGSGKSTTLYGLLKTRNRPDINISTIEDPVEYKIPRINHIQVNAKSGLSFERGLRALVRQDPDIILVGEIRDNITAQISVNAALTGHLLFSTLHANDASTAIPRLLEMEIEPYLLASTLELVIAQRLMRRICNHCRYSHTVSVEEAAQLFKGAERYFTGEKEITLYKGKGCKTCGNTGFKGRVGVYELLVITPEIEEMIVARKTSGEINDTARRQGMLTLFEDGLLKVKSGLSTVEELLRLAEPPVEIGLATKMQKIKADSKSLPS